MNTPSPVVTADQFSQILETSRLLPAQQWREFCAVAHPDAKSGARFLVRKGWLTTWQAGQLLGGFHRLVVGNYRLLKEVGRGRWGRVFQAEHRRLGRQVAIKLLAPQLCVQEERVRQFLAEIRLLAAFEHRNLIDIYDAACDGDRYYVVMEYVPGADLRQQVQRQGPLSLHRAADVAYQTAQALDHLHAHGVLHGEIQPSRLLATDAGFVKLLRAAGTMGRSPVAPVGGDSGNQYSAPEQGDGRPVDARADVYALGRTLHFLVTGRGPTTTSPNGSHPPLGPGEKPDARVPQEFAVLCARMMAYEPGDRFATMREVMAALRAWREAGYHPGPAAPGARAVPAVSVEQQAIASRGEAPASAVRRDGQPRRVVSRPALSRSVAVGLATTLAIVLLVAAFWFWAG